LNKGDKKIMPKFSKRSEEKLAECDPDLIAIIEYAARIINFSVICGHRGKEDQNKAFAEGRSKVKWPDGKHNQSPSYAVDIMPYPEEYNNMDNLIFQAGIILGIAEIAGVKLRWGGDWNRSYVRKKQSFDDLYHFELVKGE
jgi:peptidoglycan LD-endopeptidase CwlK